jgi:hypothetical protein
MKPLAAPLLLALAFLTLPPRASSAELATENVILVMIDGLRWQEVFRGAEERLISKEAGDVKEVDVIREKYWRDKPDAARETLMPFLWKTIAKEGQLFGNRDAGDASKVLNKEHFSYPGYSETLCGFVDERIDSNDKKLNPNITVLEWLARRPSVGGRVAAFGSWDVFPYIINTERSGIPVNAGWMPLEVAEDAEALAAMNKTAEELPRMWSGVRYDTFTAFGAREYLRVKKPKLLFVSLGEPDDWAHEGRYDQYLESSRTCDRLIEELWNTAQAMPEYAGKTSLVLTVDHGRGRDGDGWKNHSIDIPGSDEIWIGILGPDTPALGIRTGTETSQSQIAATVAALLGEDYHGVVTQSGAPLPDLIRVERE